MRVSIREFLPCRKSRAHIRRFVKRVALTCHGDTPPGYSLRGVSRRIGRKCPQLTPGSVTPPEVRWASRSSPVPGRDDAYRQERTMAQKTGTEIDVPKVTPGTVAELPAYVPGTEEWGIGYDTAIGHDLAKKELLDALVGVPFAITRVVFRRGIPKQGLTYEPAVCAVECVIAPEHVLRRRRIDMSMLPFEPGAQVVFNDGSTGVYRQIVAYLAASGRIELPEGAENGPMGETKYDLPPSEWTAFHAGELWYDANKDGFLSYAVNVRYSCPRGLRISEYENDYNPEGGKTRYLA